MDRSVSDDVAEATKPACLDDINLRIRERSDRTNEIDLPLAMPVKKPGIQTLAEPARDMPASLSQSQLSEPDIDTSVEVSNLPPKSVQSLANTGEAISKSL